MRRYGIILAALAVAIAACSKSSPTPTPLKLIPAPREIPSAATSSSLTTSSVGFDPKSGLAGSTIRLPGAGGGPVGPGVEFPPIVTADDPEQQVAYDAALTQGMELLADKKWAEALAAFEAADRAGSTGLTRLAIERLKRRIEQDASATQTAADIQTVLDEGRPEEASKLAAQALQQFGSAEAFDQFVKLKRQADALLAVQGEDKKARAERYREEFEAANKEGNKRAAVLALEQALQIADDGALKQRYDELQSQVTRYDELRSQAADLRRDPDKIDEALAMLQEAQKLWDTLSVRQEIEEYQLAIQNRRERLSVADFEIRGDIGIPQAGSYIADELLPAFKARYELVDRGQLANVLDELKLSGSLADDESGRRELNRVARMRYLVVGSVTPIGGLTVQARLVDNESGLVVQTAKIVAQSPEELAQKLPLLAQELMMTDEQKAAAEQKRAENAAVIEVLKPEPLTELPPAPEPIAPNAAPPRSLIPERIQAPAWGDMKPDGFDRLPPPPPPGQALQIPVLAVERDAEMRRRSLFVALELGDNLFRRGRYQDAHVHFQFALNLFPGHREVRLRVERCLPFLPTPVVVPPPLMMRPRIALVDFMVVGEPSVVPPHLGFWTPEQLAAYMAPEFQVVSRTELYWWMGRLGIAPAQLLQDPAARLYLARALNVRYFLFGNIVQTASFNVTTYLIDAEYGFLTSSARLHVRNPKELKLRIPELAWLTKLTPDQRRAVEDDNAQWVLLMSDLRRAERESRWGVVIELGTRGLKLRPNNVELTLMIANANRRQRMFELDQARNAEALRQQQILFEQQRRQLELARQAEAARQRAEQFAAARAAADQQRFLIQRQSAAQDMARRAQFMVQTKQFGVAVQLFESAVSMRPNDENLYRELALARAKAAETARADAAEAAARREAALRRERERELAQTRARLEQERQRHAAEELARRQAANDRDQREYTRLMDLAQQLSAKRQYDQAVAAAQKARQLKPTPEAERLVTQLLVDLARASAEQRGAAARAELERQLVAERQARIAAEAEAEKNRQLYESLLAQGQQFLKAEKFAEAEEQLLKARKIQQTDVLLASLKQAQSGKARLEKKLQEEREKQARLQRQNDMLKQKLADAKAALAASQLEKAVTLYQEAKKIAPTDVEVLTGLARAEQSREQAMAKARRDGEEKSRRETFQRLLTSGKQNLAANKFEAAVMALDEAVKLMPADRDAKAALAEAESKLNADAQTKAEMKKKADRYQTQIRDGRRYLAAKQYDRALQAFRAALVEVPGDQAARDFLEDAQKLKTGAETAMAADVAAKQASARQAAEVRKALVAFRTALVAGKLDEAKSAYTAAAKIDANNPEVLKALADLRNAQDASDSAMKAGQQRDRQFNDLMVKARAAIQAKKLDEASQNLAAASTLKPGDPAIKTLESQIAKARSDMAGMERQERIKDLVARSRAAIAGKKLDEADKLLDQAEAIAPRDAGIALARNELKKAQTEMTAGDEMKRKQQALATALTQARTLLQAKKFDEAEKAVGEALKLFPEDRGALLLKQQIDAARKSADAAMSAERKKEDFAKLLAQARAAIQARKTDEAAGLVGEALKLFPQDPAALALKKQLDDAKKDAAMMAQKRQEYLRLMQQGRTAMQQKKTAEAVKAFEAALALMPGDADATRALADANKPAPMPPMPPKPMAKPPVFTRQMEQGAAQEKANRYELALLSYRAALRTLPNDPEARKKVDFCQFMVDGDKAMKSRKFADARTAFDNALKLFPNDVNAKAAAKKAETAK